ncbi:MAG: hypothetical protein M3Y13_03815 [Armatimonadota bacterium]|nr:hypothetical protein [Armatimonadota bacterium]
MGLITEFVVIAPCDLPLLDTPELPPQALVRLSAKGVLSLNMALIEEALTGRDWDEAMEDYQERPVQGASRVAGPWIFQVSFSLMKALLKLEISNHHKVIAHLAQHEEFSGWGGVDGIFAFLRKLIDLAHEAESERKQIFAWVCL